MALKEASLQSFASPTTFSTTPRAGSDLTALPDVASALLADWLPAIAGLHDILQAGARVADVACGPGSSIIRMAEVFPRSQFFGYDLSVTAIETARAAAQAAGVIERTYFQISSPADFPGWGYDLICFLNGVLSLPNPQNAAWRVQTSLAENGVWLIAEAPGSESQVRALVNAAGFTTCRLALATATDAVYEVRR